jgi:hypothetical protein
MFLVRFISQTDESSSRRKNLVALESASNQPVWTVRHLGKISGLLIDKGSILGAAGRNAFAIEALSGTVRWKMSAKSNFTNQYSFRNRMPPSSAIRQIS